ncbi:MAG: SMP-30/gluconolactonase/LRE family protein [Chloroflexota bacterium]|nr:MAG: SMP-30/gluconolactonase/LRE family protein [Chloroflexota bacterium]
MGFERRAPGFDRILRSDSLIERVATGFGFTEGPVWHEGRLLFADIVNSRIVSWRRLPEGPEVTTFQAPSNLTNGLTLDRQGRLLACEGLERQIARYESDGTRSSVASSYQGKRLNSPNDVVVASDGALYFSDPYWADRFVNPYGRSVTASDRELSFSGVFRAAPGSEPIPIATDFTFPNGLAFSPDAKTLYVDDSRQMHIRAFDIRADGTLSSSRVLAELKADEPGVPDGMKVDTAGNIYCTGPGGVWIVAPSGEILGRIVTPEMPANVGWGEPDWSTLYITARSSVYRVRLAIPGVPVS